MKILVVSDTHRKDRVFFDLYDKIKPNMVLHCGDTEGSEDYLEEYCKCPFATVKGNCDLFSTNPISRVVTLYDTNILVTHGHYYNVTRGVNKLVEDAKSKNCSLVLFGHTHVPLLEEHDGVTVVNPGSLGFPRQFSRNPSYAIIEIDEKGFEVFPEEIYDD